MEVRGYMNFNKDFTYNEFQCKVGSKYEDNDNMNFFIYENPLDLLRENAPIDDRYAVVIGSGLMYRRPSLLSTEKIYIEREISLRELIEVGVKYAVDLVDAANENMDIKSSVIYHRFISIAANYRDWSLAFNTDKYSMAVNEGRHSMAVNRGDESVAVSRGDSSAAIAEGYCSVAVCTSDNSAAIVEGLKGIAISLGYNAKAKARTGSWLVLADWQEQAGGMYIRDVKSFYVDGNTVKADTFYRYEDGQLVEAQ